MKRLQMKKGPAQAEPFVHLRAGDAARRLEIG